MHTSGVNYCGVFFGKRLNELEYPDIEQFFKVEQTETDQIEFKSFNGSENDFSNIIRSIAAFVNSKGGVLIWGAPVGVKPDGRKEKVFKGPLTPTKIFMEKDALISRCSDKIIPLPNGIHVTTLKNGEGEYIYVFEIDESNYSPHQYDNLYYMRIDGQTRKAPHHYIEALFRKIRYPNIEGYIKFGDVWADPSHIHIPFDIFIANWSPLQNAVDVSFRIISTCFFSKSRHNSVEYSNEGHEWIRESYKTVLHFGQPIIHSNEVELEKRKIAGGALDFLFALGAQNTPSIFSRYTIDPKKLRAQQSAEIGIIERVENESHVDTFNGDAQKKQILSKFLGRHIA